MEPNEIARTIIGDWEDKATSVIYQFNKNNTVLIFSPKSNEAVVRDFSISDSQGIATLTIGDIPYVVKSVTQDSDFVLTICLVSPASQETLISKPYPPLQE